MALIYLPNLPPVSVTLSRQPSVEVMSMVKQGPFYRLAFLTSTLILLTAPGL